MASNEEQEITENDVAIIGMAARLPGARNIEAFWENLRDGVESVRRYTEQELLDAGESPEALRDPNYVPCGAPLQDLELFDGEFFGFSPKESAILDPQHRHFLEVAWEALENAGHPPDRFPGSVAIYGGVGMGAYFMFNVLTNAELIDSVGMFLLRHTGNDKDFLVTRVAYLLDLKGPAIGVQTACSTSLVATHMAAQALLNGECDMALAGGVTIELPHNRGYHFKDGEILSPDGHCHAFDHRSQGTIFGSGAGVVVLRRAQDAIEDGDHIHALIKGSAINNDGASKVGYLAPSVDGQAASMTEAYDIAGISPETIDYVECHGTGTFMGDPIEVSALTQAFRKSTSKKGFCRIGSVKTNIGHLDTAAGVASLIKASLALQHRQMPPTLNFEKPNPNIDFESSPFSVNDRLTPWERRGHPRRAAVNSLGVGGTNAHVVLEEPPPRAPSPPSARDLQLLVLSARSRKAVDAGAQRLADHLERHPEQPLPDVAFTLAAGRRAFEHRRVVAVRDRDEAVRLLRDNDRQRVFTHARVGDDPGVVFMMPGGGAQYAAMGHGLYDSEPVFRENVDRGLSTLQKKHGIDLRPYLFPASSDRAAADKELSRIALQLPAIFIVSYAMAKLLESWDIRPAALIGHSLGENTAACLAEVFEYEQALGLVTLRGALMERIKGGGVTTAQLGPEELAPRLEELGLDLAGVNAPGLCIVSGPVSALELLERRLEAQEVDVRRVNVPVPAHSRMFDSILGEFRDYLGTMRLSKPKIPIISNHTGDWLTDEEATSPDYWVSHLRHTVRFADGMAKLLEDRSRIYLECGPGRILSSLARAQPGADAALPAISSMRHPDHDVSDPTWFLTTIGRLWAAGAPLDLERLWEGEGRQRVQLPTYAFQHGRYWIEPGAGARPSIDANRPTKFSDLDDFFYRPVWAGAPPIDPSEDTHRHTWLLFMDPSGLAESLAGRLRARGDTVITVDVGDAYHQANDHTYIVAPERGRESYDSLVQDLLASGKAPDRIVHMWLATGEGRVRRGSSQFLTHSQYGFYSLLFLLQAVADADLPRPIDLVVVTTGGLAVREEQIPFFEKSLVAGPVKVGPREIEGLTARWVDVESLQKPTLLELLPVAPLQRLAERPSHATVPGLVNLLEREVLGRPENGVFAWRGGERYVESYRSSRVKPRAAGPKLKRGGCYLVTGGLGGLGLTFAQHLASRYAARLVLTGRTALPARESWDGWLRERGMDDRTSRRILRIRALEQAGADVMVAELDITDIETLREVVDRAEARFGRIDGVLHAAGVVRDELLQMKTQMSVEDVFGPKVHGTMVLQSVFENRDLDFMLLFSSTSTVLAPAGQVDYVAANQFLDAFAHHKSQAGLNVVSVKWGIWNEVGLAAETIKSSLEGGASESRTPIGLPLLDAKVGAEQGATVLTALYAPDTHWVLDQHRTKGGDPVLPGTGYLELAAEAVEAFGHKKAFDIENLFFLRPLHVADGEAKEVRVELERTPSGFDLEIRGRRTVKGKEGWELHAQCSLLLGGVPGARPIDVAALEARCGRVESSPEGASSPQSVHLGFGARWFNLRRAAYGAGEAVARLSLPDAFAEEASSYRLHPALVDIATGFAMHLIPGYDAATLWVPVSYQRVRYHRPLPAEIVSWVRLRKSSGGPVATFDVVLAEPSGRVCVEVDQFSVKRLDGKVDFAVASDPSAAEFRVDQRGGRQLSPAEEQLLRNMEQGILPAEGIEALERVLSPPLRPETVVSSMPLDQLVRQQEQLSARVTESGSTKFDRPDLDSEYVEPRDDVERTIVGFWEELLGVNQVGVNDSFFDLGGHSLIAVRLFAKIRQAYSVDYPISILFEAPTVERCASMIKEALGAQASPATGPANGAANGAAEGPASAPSRPGLRYIHLVPMHKGEGGPKRPFFLVAGMFGNVLNLGHLANLIGADRPFYGLQARGLFGDAEPHETFEEAARDYIGELRQVQPDGPYLLGGFSGGGLTAWEMALQLVEAGQEVAMLLLLDSRLPKAPPLTSEDRLRMKLIDLQRSGPSYVVDWGKSRLEWEMKRARKRFFPAEENLRPTPTSFQNEAIEAAHYRALERYEMRPFPGRTVLFRPKLSPAYIVGEGRWISDEKRYMFHDNGFGRYAPDLDVYETPGDHDSMVLEPNVRVMARRLRRCIERAEQEIEAREQGEATPPRDQRELELARSVRGPRDFSASP